MIITCQVFKKRVKRLIIPKTSTLKRKAPSRDKPIMATNSWVKK